MKVLSSDWFSSQPDVKCPTTHCTPVAVKETSTIRSFQPGQWQAGWWIYLQPKYIFQLTCSDGSNPLCAILRTTRWVVVVLESYRTPRVFGDKFGDDFGDKVGDSLNFVINMVTILVTHFVRHQICHNFWWTFYHSFWWLTKIVTLFGDLFVT